MTDKENYDRQLNQIYSRYEQKIDQLGDLSHSKPPKTIIIFLLVCFSLITSVVFIPVRQTLFRFLPFSSVTVCPHSRKADINLIITDNQNCYVISLRTEVYSALISGDIDGYTNGHYHLTRRLSEPLSRSHVLYRLYVDLFDLDYNYLGTKQIKRIVSR